MGCSQPSSYDRVGVWAFGSLRSRPRPDTRVLRARFFLSGPLRNSEAVNNLSKWKSKAG